MVGKTNSYILGTNAILLLTLFYMYLGHKNLMITPLGGLHKRAMDTGSGSVK